MSKNKLVGKKLKKRVPKPKIRKVILKIYDQVLNKQLRQTLRQKGVRSFSVMGIDLENLQGKLLLLAAIEDGKNPFEK